ncbi:hypothetical protein COV93_01820 [Candidatus Woesearchaeota archaeon CG11_big_fil_rev_8_21_14_0_20_43_8]|nr:MAG: hypothetical protein COV93_01820 [Candidatus Woesearchaeota archaeon CG11_big_fil_rev_8_21_14_0_20_43_8]PIO05557.1 MAG: hypothetical protein COT47_04265 [Candidatus Woesearchaeota archaeon CG08_land_8_20_14_0_20_43_7]
MLESKTIKQISDFVYIKPRTIQEIAHLINKNWRTADRYVAKMIEETGSLSIRTLRGGTRGALKIVFWNNAEKIHSQEFQERLFTRIERSVRKNDFSPFDIYQHVDPKKRQAYLVEEKDEKIVIDKDLFSLLRSAQKHIFFFSGNVSWVSIIDDEKALIDVLEDLPSSIAIKVLTKVDITSRNNVTKLMRINEAKGKEMIEIRHCEQPLRGIIIDSRIARFREIKDPGDYKRGELDRKTYIYYEINDPDWVEWLEKVFWKQFRTANLAKKRLESLDTIENLY